MPYENLATSETPALIIYLIDVSTSMNKDMAGKRRIDVVTDAIQAAFRQMIFRSTKGAAISPRYKLAMYAYSDEVYDVYDGFMSIDKVAQLGPPELTTVRLSNTARAFLQARNVLQHEIPYLDKHPAPLVCHLTDGEYTGEDPEPIVRDIMRMSTPDGPILVENIFVSDEILPEPVGDVHHWPGVRPQTSLTNAYAIKLRAMSSPLPESYRAMMEEMGYHIASDAVMMIPGSTPGLVEMGFQMSGSTKMR
jgi:hypothetical protein